MAAAINLRIFDSGLSSESDVEEVGVGVGVGVSVGFGGDVGVCGNIDAGSGVDTGSETDGSPAIIAAVSAPARDSTSLTMILPLGPLPVTPVSAIPFSPASFLARGEILIFPSCIGYDVLISTGISSCISFEIVVSSLNSCLSFSGRINTKI